MSAALANPMIYPQRAVADQIAERMTAIKGSKYGVVKLPHGFQVVAITVCPDYMPPAKPKPILKMNADKFLVSNGDELTYTFKLVGEGLTYITVLVDGKQMAFGKSTLLAWAKVGEDMIQLKVSKAVAKKRGLYLG